MSVCYPLSPTRRRSSFVYSAAFSFEIFPFSGESLFIGTPDTVRVSGSKPVSCDVCAPLGVLKSVNPHVQFSTRFTYSMEIRK